MKKLISFLFILFSVFLTLGYSQTPVNINQHLVFSYSGSNSNIAYDEIIFNNSPILTNSLTNGILGYYLINTNNNTTNALSSFIPSNTTNGTYYISARDSDVAGNHSLWSTNLVVNFFNPPPAPVGLQVIQ